MVFFFFFFFFGGKKKRGQRENELSQREGKTRIAGFSHTSSDHFASILTSVGAHGSSLARLSSRAFEATKNVDEARKKNRMMDKDGNFDGAVIDDDDDTANCPRRRRAAGAFFSIWTERSGVKADTMLA